MKMEPTKYLIGDIANLIGVSRDTLRYYEKRGILDSKKGDNGYRYYTDEDIALLVSVLYQRKMNISLEHIETIWSGDNTVSALTELMEERLAEEEQAIWAHKQTIARLRLTRRDCQRIQHQLGEIFLRQFPDAYVIVPHTTREESTEKWFQMSREFPGLDMMYTFDSYELKTGSPLKMHYENTQLVLYKELADVVDYDCSHRDITSTPEANCVYSFCTSDSRIPEEEQIRRMVTWAKEKNISMGDKVYSTYATQGLRNGVHTYYLEIYIPVL